MWKRKEVLLTEVKGLTCLPSLEAQVRRDSRRCAANISLNKSMAAWMVHKARGEEPSWLQAPAEFVPMSSEVSRRNSVARASSLLLEPMETSGGSRTLASTRQSRVLPRRTSLVAGCVSLEEAYKSHIAGFVRDGESKISVEELILILQRCRLFDEHFTADKVRNHCSTWADGCNRAHRMQALGLDGIGYLEFEHMLRWASDVKCVEFRLIVQKVVRLAKKLGDKAGTVQQKLEFVFDTCGQQAGNRMSPFEFGSLCHRLQLRFSMGDIIIAFKQYPRGIEDGVEFREFVEIVTAVGQQLGLGDEIYNIFAQAVEFLGTRDKTLNRLRARFRRAALVVMGEDWAVALKKFTGRSSQTIDWAEFMSLCITTLHLVERESHLEMLFDFIDVDANGEFPVQHLIDFMEREEAPATAR